MPVVQRQSLRKKPELWIDAHTRLSGGQVEEIVKAHRKHIAVGGDDNPIAFQHELIVLLVEAWNLPDSDKPEEVLPKSLEGCKRAFQDDLIDVWKFVRPLTETAFPND